MAAIAKKCEQCANFSNEKGGRCHYPAIVKTFKDGRDAKEARMPGRFCGPEGTMFVERVKHVNR